MACRRLATHSSQSSISWGDGAAMYLPMVKNVSMRAVGSKRWNHYYGLRLHFLCITLLVKLACHQKHAYLLSDPRSTWAATQLAAPWFQEHNTAVISQSNTWTAKRAGRRRLWSIQSASDGMYLRVLADGADDVFVQVWRQVVLFLGPTLELTAL